MPLSTNTWVKFGPACEIRFLVHRALAEPIIERARQQLLPDPHTGGYSDDAYRMTSLYFDTAAFDVFHRRGSFARTKYRIRRYGPAEFAFLERKIKTRNHLSKRRCVIELTDLDRLKRTQLEPDWAGHWFHRRIQVRQLEPVCQIACDRTARVAMTEHGPIRLTLDRNLRAQPAAGLSFSDRNERSILENWMILEMKFRCEMPELFKTLVEDFALNPHRFSKYRHAIASLGLNSTVSIELPKKSAASGPA